MPLVEFIILSASDNPNPIQNPLETLSPPLLTYARSK